MRPCEFSHPRESGDPEFGPDLSRWVPAFAEMTVRR